MQDRVQAFEENNSIKFIKELKRGSVEAFDRLALSLFRPLWRYFVNCMDIPEPDAMELSQDVLMKVYYNVGTFRCGGRAKLTTWIYSIAHNLAIDFRRTSREKLLDLAETSMPVRWNGEFAGRNASYLVWLKDQLLQLVPDDRYLLLERANDRSYAEIARDLKIKEVTARVRHKRAMDRLSAAALRAQLDGDVPEQEIQTAGATNE